MKRTYQKVLIIIGFSAVLLIGLIIGIVAKSGNNSKAIAKIYDIYIYENEVEEVEQSNQIMLRSLEPNGNLLDLSREQLIQQIAKKKLVERWIQKEHIALSAEERKQISDLMRKTIDDVSSAAISDDTASTILSNLQTDVDRSGLTWDEYFSNLVNDYEHFVKQGKLIKKVYAGDRDTFHAELAKDISDNLEILQ